MKRKPISEVKNKEEARQIAINWQNWQSEKSLSYVELTQWGWYFVGLGKRYRLTNEFIENGII